jgi:rod shape-determining protein MreD
VRALLILGFVLALLFETTLGPRLSPVGGRPLLLLSVVVYFAWMRGAVPGTLFGLGLGLLADLLALETPGLQMLGMCLVGAIVGNSWGSVYKDRPLAQALVLAGAVFLHLSIVYFAATRLDVSGYPRWLLTPVFPSMVMTGLAFPLLIRLWEQLLGREVSLDAQRVVHKRR